MVDDDPINNLICEKTIKLFLPEAEVHTFLDPAVALAYINTTYSKPDASKAVLFLDINMPAITGWEFLDAVEKFQPTVKERLKIHMLTSSNSIRDKELAEGNERVLDYFEKPLVREIVEDVLSKLGESYGV